MEERLNARPGLLRKTKLAYEGAQEAPAEGGMELGRRGDALKRLDVGRAGLVRGQVRQ